MLYAWFIRLLDCFCLGIGKELLLRLGVFVSACKGFRRSLKNCGGFSSLARVLLADKTLFINENGMFFLLANTELDIF